MAKKLWKLKRSKIHGNGLFAAHDIPEGTQIIEYIGEKIRKKESLKRCLEWEENARKTGEGLVYIFDLDKKWDLDGNVPDNPAKYINHSCDENCEAVNEENRIFIYSTKDIFKGQELYFDYGYALEHFIDHPCRCSSEDCVGYIVAKTSRKKLKNILRKKEAKSKDTKKAKKKSSKTARKSKAKRSKAKE